MENHRSEEEILTVKGLSVSFTQYDRGFGRKEIQAVTDLDLRIRSGEIVAVVGAVVRLAPEQAEAAQRAKKAAEALGIECILLNAEALAQQPGAAGAWPQFAALLTAADKLGIQYIGSSSRARLEVGTDGVHTVLPPVDAARDDSTALAALPQETLARLLLPLGEFDAGDLAELAQELQL